MIFHASRPQPQPSKSRAKCVRCGFERSNGSNTSPLCMPYKTQLTPTERKLWAA